MIEIRKIVSSQIVIILIAVVIGILLGKVVNEAIIGNIVMIIKHIAGQIIFFLVPLIVFAFVSSAIVSLKSNATQLLVFAFLVAYLSSEGAAFLSMALSYVLVPLFHIQPIDNLLPLPKPLFTLEIKPVMEVVSALVLAVLVGIGTVWIRSEKLIGFLQDFQKLVLQLVTKVLLPVLPFYIAANFCIMSYQGNIERFGETSGMPRAIEGARYYAQWAGMPYSVYSGRQGTDDYADDINVRSFMTNYMGGGSCYMPTLEGRKVPIELSLGIHSDAGYFKNGKDIWGSLSICTTNHHEGKLNAGISRMASRDLADALLNNEVADLKYKYGDWVRRDLYDRNYSESRVPEVPSAILETLSHQSFPDLRYGLDPNFRFTLARSIYKTLLRYVNDQHGTSSVVAPLAPDNFRIEFKNKNEIQLSWNAVNDPQEPTAKPTGYLLYTAVGNADFDNGTNIKKTSHEMKLEPGLTYHFRVAAVNRGGESFCTEVLSARYQPEATKTVMIVNGFHRLSSPAIRDNDLEQGFDLDEDPGITYGPTFGWVGRQTNFDITQMGNENGGLGYSGEELQGQLIAGNDFNYVRTHADAIASARQYNIVSCSNEAVETGRVNLSRYAAVDLVLGLERNDGHSVNYYKSFTSLMQKALQKYSQDGGALFVSGAYVGTDMTADDEQLFLANVLKCRYAGRSQAGSSTVNGLGTTLDYWNTLNATHYAATSTDILQPVKPAFTAMQYADGQAAAIAYKQGNERVFVMGFPFECIKDRQKRSSIMQGILNYLLNK